MISVIIPVYNQANFIKQAINSILAQSLSPCEIIVINDGSEDNIREVLQPFCSQITYIEHAHRQGASAARNTGVEQSKGEFIAFLDGDDYWQENKLSRQYHLIQQKKETDLVFSLVQNFYCPELNEGLKLKLHCPEEPLVGCCPSALFARKSSFMKVGYFNTNLKTGEFIDWYLRAKRMSLNFDMDEAVTVFRRIHQGHFMKNYRDYFSIIKHKLANDKAAV